MEINQQIVKSILGEVPFLAELYWQWVQGGKPVSKVNLDMLHAALPAWVAAAEKNRAQHPLQDGQRILVVGGLKAWLNHTPALVVALAGQGHHVTLATIPFANWWEPVNAFDLRRQKAYIADRLRPLSRLAPVKSLWDGTQTTLPDKLAVAVEQLSLHDVQYTFQVEDLDLTKNSPHSQLFELRKKRNQIAAQVVWRWLKNNQFDHVIVPNGSILEFGATYLAARHAGIPVVTYEFGEQRKRIWLAQDTEIMRQETDALWRAHGKTALTPEQTKRIQDLFAARHQGKLWSNFARRWQGVVSQGGQAVRQALNLDDRPLVLIATNVIGDSLALGREVFSKGLVDWIRGTLKFFEQHPEVQVVVRIHPGELITKGPSVAQVITKQFPQFPENIHLVLADEQVNTYDLVEIADLGLVYTTTVGLEMALSGIPVIVAGQTHYRKRGFTRDAESWTEYLDLLNRWLQTPEDFCLSEAQVQSAWRYAYVFFFVFPRPFPWHVQKFWEDVKIFPPEQIFSPEGQALYGETLAYFVGKSLDWTKIPFPEKE